jgi:hypothetical protein
VEPNEERFIHRGAHDEEKSVKPSLSSLRECTSVCAFAAHSLALLPYDELGNIAEVAWAIPLRPHQGLDGIPRFLLTFRGEVSGGGRRQHIPGQVKVLIVKAERLGLVVYLRPAGKYQRPAWRLSQEQKGLDERPLKASQRPSEPW